MNISAIQNRPSEKGFTLVELAIVMIIIGLLIGGILKGQELINNARISSQVTQFKGIEVAVNTFREKYSGMPGDILTPATRVPNCTGACNNDGNANGRIDEVLIGAAMATADNENSAAFAQLVQSDMLAGTIDPSAPVATASAVGVNLIEAKFGGANLRLGYHPGGLLAGSTAAAGTPGGHYVALSTQLAGAITNADTNLTPNEADRIDTKVDDGVAVTGSVLAIGAGAAADCHTAGVYNELLSGKLCGLYIRMSE
jgi:prepilin-type N-terminal cleavage/methylation domain-containing protein